MNQDIKNYAKSKGVRLWRVAEELGTSDSGFSRMLRHEFSEERKQEIMEIIDQLAERGTQNGENSKQ